MYKRWNKAKDTASKEEQNKERQRACVHLRDKGKGENIRPEPLCGGRNQHDLRDNKKKEQQRR